MLYNFTTLIVMSLAVWQLINKLCINILSMVCTKMNFSFLIEKYNVLSLEN